MPGVDYTEVRRQITMSEVLQLVGFTANRIRGDQQRGPCPIHGSSREGSRIISVNLELSEFGARPIPVFPVRFTRERLGIMVGGARR